MRMVRKSLLAVSGVWIAGLLAGCLTAQEPETSLGEMTRFYRGQAVLSENWSIGGLQAGGEICVVPEYLTDPDLDFPYMKKDSARELMFTDRITAVRFLGGIADDIIPLESEHGGKLDLAYRDEDGELRYRWSSLDRFDPFAELFGSNITVVLDNIPSAFISNPHIDNYGQIVPPEDYDEWSRFIRALCRELIRRYGEEHVSEWRFRICTEARIHTDTEGFCRHYDETVAAVRAVLPGAKFSPYNAAGIHQLSDQHIDFYGVLEHCAETGAPFDFAPVSYYSVALTSKEAEQRGPLVVTDPSDDRMCRWTVSPALRTEEDYFPFWERIDRELGRRVPREIQELGILFNEYGDFTAEPGARGAAWLFHLLFHMKEVNDIRYAWHWHVTDPIMAPGTPREDSPRLLRGNGWLYSILDHTEGADLYRFEVESKSPDRDLLLKAIGFKDADDGHSYLILSAFNIDRTRPFEQTVTVTLPPWFVRPERVNVRQTRLDDATDVYRAMRRDLEREGLLNPNIAADPNALYAVTPVRPEKSLATGEGKRYLEKNWESYETMIRDALTLKPFGGELTPCSGGTELKLPVSTPSVTVLRFD
ncbi:GH39 family glycosyl hydrolase [Kiritimatiella glycovorans]|uniref:Beta-xylosidase n=1 Tax=Kiritimatiella glycovorans TaxID=1307763 RepID=A0A0G3EHL1_9BACT|nr:hypothetical protein [Kiritimatiella glycovorans]AKJ63684.1 Beta-xylosidase [Kiritimatiella glycovorans]